MDNRAAVGRAKTFVLGLVAGTMLAQLGVSVAATSHNAAARDLAAAKLFAFGGVGVAGIMSVGERNLRGVLQQSDASQQLQGASRIQRQLANFTFSLACAAVIIPRIRKCSIRWPAPTTTLKSRMDV